MILDPATATSTYHESLSANEASSFGSIQPAGFLLAPNLFFKELHRPNIVTGA